MKTPMRQLSIITPPVLAFLAFVCLGAIQPQDIARLPSVTNAFGDDLVVVLNGRSEAAKMTVKQISDYAAAHGGGSQTPWASDINGGLFALTNINYIRTDANGGPSLFRSGVFIDDGITFGIDQNGLGTFSSLSTLNGGGNFATTLSAAAGGFTVDGVANVGAFSLDIGGGALQINNDGSIITANWSIAEDGTFQIGGHAFIVSPSGAIVGSGAGITLLDASQLTTGTVSQDRFGITNFTKYAAGTAYTLTATNTALTFGTTQPVLTINQAGTYLISGNVGIKYSGATYTVAQTATLKLRRTNNTAADLANGSRTTEMPVLTTFTGGDVFSMPPVVYTAANGDTVTIFGALSATPAAGSVLTDSAELVAIRLY